jgi:hypothetical protein
MYVWPPYQATLTDRIEKVQRRFIRIVGMRMGFGYMDASMNLIEMSLNLQSLSHRITLLDALFLRNIVTGKIDSPDLLPLINFRILGHTRSYNLFGEQTVATNYAYGGVVPRLHRVGNMIAVTFSFLVVVYSRDV